VETESDSRRAHGASIPIPGGGEPVVDLFEFATSGSAVSGDDPPDPGDDAGPLVHAPFPLVGALVGELIACLVCFVPNSKPAHVIGYLIGAVLVGLTAVAYRNTDRVRRRSTAYVMTPWCAYAVASALVVGILLAAIHAFYFAQTKHLAT
jgi:hypothetical protein